MKILYRILIVFGFALTSAVYAGLRLDENAQNMYSILFMVLIIPILGLYGQWTLKASYKGGTTSTIGLIHVLLSILMILTYIEGLLSNQENTVFIGITVFFLLSGVPLLVAGHKIHNERCQRHE